MLDTLAEGAARLDPLTRDAIATMAAVLAELKDEDRRMAVAVLMIAIRSDELDELIPRARPH
jgi:hypothetical protein